MSDILDTAHELATDLHSVGALDTITMRKMDLLCLPAKRTISPSDIQRIRRTTHMSQPVFAMLLNVGSSTIAQWEAGQRKPSGPARVLLTLLAKDPEIVTRTLKAA